MVWIPESVIWAKAYQLCGPGKNATPFWRAAQQILAAEQLIQQATASTQEMESRFHQVEQRLQEAENRSLAAEHALGEARQQIQTLEAALAAQRSTLSNPSIPVSASASSSGHPQPLALAIVLAVFYILGLVTASIVPFVSPNSTQIDSSTE